MSLRFGVWLPPYHRVGLNPTQQLQDDLGLLVHLDQLGFEEAWIGEHHSGGSEIIGSPEVFIAAAAERTERIRLGTGVNSLPYHHPFILADRWVLLSHLTRGRAMFGAGPGSLTSDHWQMGIDVMESRRLMEVALEAVVALLEREEPVTMETEAFTLREARLQLAPYNNEFDLRVATSFSPSGPRAAGRFGLGMISVGATTPLGFEALKGTWGIAEERATEFGRTLDRSRWAVVAPLHLAETVEQARRDVEYGIGEWLYYFKRIAPLEISADPDDIPAILEEFTNTIGLAVIGTPDMAIEKIESLIEQTGGVGAFLIMGHDWANPDATYRSYELFARHVIPRFNGSLPRRLSNYDWVLETSDEARTSFIAAQQRARDEHDAERSAKAPTGSTSAE
jgi:limonene 1,2-monooxygenase